MSLRKKLRKQIQPEGELELQTFERYLHAIEQSERFRAFELESQSRWSNEPNHPQWFHQMERIQKLAAAAGPRPERNPHVTARPIRHPGRHDDTGQHPSQPKNHG